MDMRPDNDIVPLMSTGKAPHGDRLHVHTSCRYNLDGIRDTRRHHPGDVKAAVDICETLVER